MITVKNLCKAFGEIQAVNHVSFCLKKGEVAALLGPNGAGKSTLMRLLTGYLKPDSGEIRLANYNLPQNLLAALRHVGYVPENSPLYSEMGVFEFLRYMAALRELPKDTADANICLCVEQLRLESVLSQKIETLSKGYKKRVAIAAALVHLPKILILDEPTEGLDPVQKDHIRNFIKNYGQDNIVIISTHIMEEVEAMANRVILIHHGRILRDTTPETLKKIHKEHDLSKAFLQLVQDD